RAKPAVQRAEQRGIEPRPDLADLEQPAVVAVRGQPECPKPRARTLRRRVADDHELLFPQALDLQPLPSPARPVGRITALRDDAFQPQATGLSVEGRTITLDMVAVLDHITRQAAKHRLQQG